MLNDQSIQSPLAKMIMGLSEEISSGIVITAPTLEEKMTQAIGASAATGAWLWRDAYNQLEAASARSVLLDQRDHLQAAAFLEYLTLLSRRIPTQTKRTDQQIRLQQFSTPLPYSFIAAKAAAIATDDQVLEPSAGTGCLAVFAKLFGAKLHVNEIDQMRCNALQTVVGLHPSSHDAALIDDLLTRNIQPTVVLMNPPFSSSFDRTFDKDMACRHIHSALKRLVSGGRLVAIMPASFSSAQRPDFWKLLSKIGTFRLRMTVPGAVYRKNGTSVDTCLIVIDKTIDTHPLIEQHIEKLSDAFALIDKLPARDEIIVTDHAPLTISKTPSVNTTPRRKLVKSRQRERVNIAASPLAYQAHQEPKTNEPVSPVYAAYSPQRLSFDGAKKHPTPLVESIAMASVSPPYPDAQPILPPQLLQNGTLSDAQLETIIYADQAHSKHLDGHWAVNKDGLTIEPRDLNADDAIQFRRGFFIGDGTGCGKGRQIAAIIMNNWLGGNRRALWISKSDSLFEDAIRDWTDLGGSPTDLKNLSRWKSDDEIELSNGIVFTTYATLRSASQHGRTRLDQIHTWLGSKFNGVIAWDEAHAMGNAIGRMGSRGKIEASKQGITGVRTQNIFPDARIVYVSATGATTVENLAYATRLGIWGAHPGYPFTTREEFIASMNAGGTAAMEVVARDLKTLGLYLARSLSFEGVQYEITDITLTERQRKIYDRWADAFQIIHTNIGEALRATNLTAEDGKSNNGQRKAAIMSRFESLKQRFFNHLLIGMSTPTIIKKIEEDIERGDAAVIQIISTGEALLNRRIEQLSEEEKTDLQIDLTPREYVLDYLNNAFPINLERIIEDEHGNKSTEPVVDPKTGVRIVSREAEQLRDKMLTELASIDAVPTPIDQIIWHFGADNVAEMTGRSQRAIFKGEGELKKLVIDKRGAQANKNETAAFMNDEKKIAIFSEAGGTGRSYHAANTAINQRQRKHYLLEPGWKADVAIQGLGRSHRSAQVSTPIYCVPTTDVQGQKRFTSTIARRLDSLGALTKGQRETGTQGMFRPEDNLESSIARSTLKAFLRALAFGNAKSITINDFTEQTGLSLYASDGALKDELPPMSQFLNRILALKIDTQNRIFTEFTEMIEDRTEAARRAGTLDIGVETIEADSLIIKSRTVLQVDPQTNAETAINMIERKRPQTYMHSQDARALTNSKTTFQHHKKQGDIVIKAPARSVFREDGTSIKQFRLIYPDRTEYIFESEWKDEDWMEVDDASFDPLWDQQIRILPSVRIDTFGVLTGLLLPIWKYLPNGQARIWRLKTDDDVNLLGPTLNESECAEIKALLAPTEAIDASTIFTAVATEKRAIKVGSGSKFKARRVGATYRFEIEDAPFELIDHLKSIGCFTEIISWKNRVFIPYGEDVPESQTINIIKKVLDTFCEKKTKAAA